MEYNKKKERFYRFKIDDGSILAVSARNKTHAKKKAKEWSIWINKRGYKHAVPEYIGLERYVKI